MAPPPGMGRGMMEGPNLLLHGNFQIELIYALVVIAACLFIFYKTREMYKLSGHQGIGYFRLAFLFFAIAFGARMLIPLSNYLFDIRPWTLREFTGFIIIFTGTLAVLYVLFSVLHKHLRMDAGKQHVSILFIAITISALTLEPQARLYLLGLQLIIFVATTVMVLFDHLKLQKKKRSSWYLVYLLLFFAWLANLLTHFTQRISFEITYSLYIISACLFLLIAIRVLKRTMKK